MNCDEFEQLAALEALGALDATDAERLRIRLARVPGAAAELARFLAVPAALAALPPPVRPRSEVREQVLARVRRTPQSDRPADPAGGQPPVPLPGGFRLVRGNAPWLPGPVPGTRFKVLSAGRDQAYAMLLLEMAAGAAYPEHDHVGIEDLYVLTGDLQTEGRSLGPGDLLHATPGSHHHELRSVDGCTAILVVPRDAIADLALA